MTDWVSITDQFERVDEYEIDDHLFELYSERSPPDNLGFVNRSSNTITITLPQSNLDLTIKQSLSELSSSKESSSTGFICWQSSVYFVDWLLSQKECPFAKIFQSKNDRVIVELGAGVAGICASLLSSNVSRYIATDQKHILKLLKENIESNISTSKYKSSTLDAPPVSRSGGGGSNSIASIPIVDVLEFDWEDIDQGLYNYNQLIQGNKKPDILIACDTIYNEYLIPHFLNGLRSLLNKNSIALVVLQLRDSLTLETFVKEIVIQQKLKLYSIPLQMLSHSLQSGFVIYCITL